MARRAKGRHRGGGSSRELLLTLRREKIGFIAQSGPIALHPETEQLSPLAVDMIHQIITDQGRISESSSP